jgi:putative peptide zinc metalloprotease protein
MTYAKHAGPCCKPDIIVDPVVGTSRVVHSPATQRYFRMGEREAGFLASLDGTRTLDALHESNEQGFNVQEVDHLLAWYTTNGLLVVEQVVLEDTRSRSAKLLDRLANPSQWRWKLLDPDRLLERHIDMVHGLFSPAAMAAYLIILLAPLCLFVYDPALLNNMKAVDFSVLAWTDWAMLYVSLLGVIAIHEAAHAVTCKHFGGKVHSVGVKLLYLQPVAYCDVSDSWRFGKVGQKVMVTMAGIFAQLLLSSLAVATWMVTGWELLPYFAAFNTAIALLNLIPFIKLDGYWTLVHILDEPNLRASSFQQLDQAVRGLLGGRGGNTVRFRPGLLGFGVLSLAAAIGAYAWGVYALYSYALRISDTVALSVVVVFALMLLQRWCRPTFNYVKSLFVGGAPA